MKSTAQNHSDEVPVSDESNDESDRLNASQDEVPTHDHAQDYQLVRDRQKRQVKAPKRYGYADLIAFSLHSAHMVDVEEPKSYEKVVSCQ